MSRHSLASSRRNTLHPFTLKAIHKGCWLLLIIVAFVTNCFAAGVGTALGWPVVFLVLGAALLFMVSVVQIVAGMVIYRKEFAPADWIICILLPPVMFSLFYALGPSMKLHDVGLRWNQSIKPRQIGPVKILGSLSGASEALGMAPNGDVFGRYDVNWSFGHEDSTILHAFIWHNGQMHDLGETHSVDLVAANDRGQILVNDGNNRNPRASIWSEGSRLELGTLGGLGSIGLWMDNTPRVLGQSQTSNGEWHWFLWQAGTMKDLGLSGDWDPEHLNIRGDYIFNQYPALQARSQAYVWRHNQLTEIGSPSGDTFATAINDHGHVAGWFTASDGHQHAFLWADGVMTNLPDNGEISEATALNNLDQVVGYTSSPSRACIWSSRRLRYLNDYLPKDSGFHLSKAKAINDQGEIAGDAHAPNGYDFAFLLKLHPLTLRK